MLNLVAAYRYKGTHATENKNENESKMMLLHSLLKQYMDSEEPMVRFVATRFMATVFPPQHIYSKYLLLVATGDSKDEVYTEALKALYGPLYKQGYDHSGPESESEEKRLNLPPFREFMHYVYNESNARMQKTTQCYTQGNHILPYMPNVYKEVIASSLIVTLNVIFIHILIFRL